MKVYELIEGGYFWLASDWEEESLGLFTTLEKAVQIAEEEIKGYSGTFHLEDQFLWSKVRYMSNTKTTVDKRYYIIEREVIE